MRVLLAFPRDITHRQKSGVGPERAPVCYPQRVPSPMCRCARGTATAGCGAEEPHARWTAVCAARTPAPTRSPNTISGKKDGWLWPVEKSVPVPLGHLWAIDLLAEAPVAVAGPSWGRSTWRRTRRRRSTAWRRTSTARWTPTRWKRRRWRPPPRIKSPPPSIPCA